MIHLTLVTPHGYMRSRLTQIYFEVFAMKDFVKEVGPIVLVCLFFYAVSKILELFGVRVSGHAIDLLLAFIAFAFAAWAYLRIVGLLEAILNRTNEVHARLESIESQLELINDSAQSIGDDVLRSI
jgi:hypothetical protein